MYNYLPCGVAGEEQDHEILTEGCDVEEMQ